MRFGKKLRNSVYEPWKAHYIDYAKLKKLLRESDGSGEQSSPLVTPGGAPDNDADEWTENDEAAFVEELLNVQLEKVNSFQVETSKQLRDRTSDCESKLEKLAASATEEDDPDKSKTSAPAIPENERRQIAQEVLKKLDTIAKEVNELEKYSRINFTGFLKAAKKHDRKRGLKYRVRPLLQVRLGSLPFNSEDYSPLLYRLSAMYSFVRQIVDGPVKDKAASICEDQTEGQRYTSHKYWVHPDNLLEVKTYILRRLPVLVYNPQTSRVAEGRGSDPTITSLYFDNPSFALYSQKVDRTPEAASLRLRWYGQLGDNPEITFEKKIMLDGNNSEEIRFPIKEKYVQSFIQGDYRMEKTVQKLQGRQDQTDDSISQFERTVNDIQSFIKEKELQPVVRANYKRTAFQIPGDDSIRISLDTDLALIREDALDIDRPCRDPDDWHRTDIDGPQMEYPFDAIRKGEVSRFPFALLEIKVRDGARKKRTKDWVSDLTGSHLVKEAPRFSKFVHGVAQLFEDYVNSFPFWLSEVETDIRKDPEVAFEQEQEKKARRAEDEFAVGSFLGSRSSPAFKAAIGSPAGRSQFRPKSVDENGQQLLSSSPRGKASDRKHSTTTADASGDESDHAHGTKDATPTASEPTRGLLSILPSLSLTRYGRAHQASARVPLPPGVHAPGPLIKDSGPVQVEAKVWLANQRTFIKWQHVSVLLATLSVGLYNAAGAANSVARALAVVYTLIAGGTAAWGWWIYMVRSRLIRERSGRDFDNVLGPVAVCAALVVALCVNFGFKYRTAVAKLEVSDGGMGNGSKMFSGGVGQELR